MSKNKTREWKYPHFDYVMDQDSRIVYLFGDVEDDLTHTVIKSIEHLNRINNSPITLKIKTNGGDECNMFSLYDCITASASPINTIGIGLVASAGPLLLAAGDHRSATANCSFMIHQSGLEISGKVGAVSGAAKYYIETQKKWVELMSKHSKLDVKKLSRMISTGFDFDFKAEQALQFGIIDEII